MVFQGHNIIWHYCGLALKCTVECRRISYCTVYIYMHKTTLVWFPSEQNTSDGFGQHESRFPLYSLDKIQLPRLMLSSFSQLEFPVVASGQHTITISKYKSLLHMSSYIGTFIMWNQISAGFIFTWPEKLSYFSVQFTCILCLIWWNLQVLDR
jgi:hypothetical protein